MPLTPQSRIYEEKLANRRKKQQMRNDISKSRFKGNTKPVESFSKPTPKQQNNNVNSYENINPTNMLGMGLDYFGNNVLLPAIQKAQGDIGEITNIGESAQGTLFGGLAIGSLASPSGKSKGIETATRTLGPRLASEISGVGSRRQDLTNFVLRRGAGIFDPSNTRQVVVETAESTTDLAQQLGPKFVSTIKNKSDAIRKDIYDYIIGDRTIGQYMDEEGLDLFHTFDDRAAEEADAVAGVVRPVLNNTQQAVNESLDLMGVFAPSGKFMRRIIDPIANKAQHLWENDHAASGSVAKGIITESAKEMILREGKLTSEWRDSTDELLKFIDDPNNLRTVSRWYNQFKSNKSPEIMLTELNQKFPELAKHVKSMDYLDYLMTQWDEADTIARQIPYAEGILSKVGGLGEFARSVPRSYPPSPF